MHIRVNGIPAPQGSKRHVGGGRMVESSRAVGPWREAVRAETQLAIDQWASAGQCRGPQAAYETPVDVQIQFWLPRPRSHYGKRGLLPSAPERPGKRPDGDKLTRAVWDGLVAGGAIADDSLIVDWGGHKDYADDWRPAGCDIDIKEA
jgi:crossover junction endodeoxyribonuclease RusA